MRISLKKNLGSTITLSIVFCSVLFFSYNALWMGDDLYYQYNFSLEPIPLGDNTIQFGEPINSYHDVLTSQNKHYLGRNGRWVTHVLVQSFCGIWGQTAFAVCNALVYLALIVIISAFCHKNIKNLGNTIWTSAVILFICFRLPMSPSLQINYVWMYTIALGFIYLFFKHKDETHFMAISVLGIFSLIAGECHETINIGIGVALIYNWVRSKFHYTRAQYIMSIAFGTGLLILCLAPGNFLRIENKGSSSLIISLYYLFYYTRALYILIAVIALAVTFHHRTLKQIWSENSFLWVALLGCIVFDLFIGISYSRIMLGIEILSIVLTVRILPSHSFNLFWNIAFSLCVILFWYNQNRQIKNINRQYEDVISQYKASSDGRVYITDLLQSDEGKSNHYSEAIHFTQSGFYEYSLQKHFLELFGKDKCLIKILPEYIKAKADSKSNVIVPCGSETYLLIQSKQNPADFSVHRSISIGGFKIMEFEPLILSFDKAIDENDKWRAIIVTEPDYTVLGLTKTVFCIEKEQNRKQPTE